MGEIYRWIFLFQEFDFEIIVKPGRLNSGLGHLLRLESGEEPIILDHSLPNAQLFAIEIIDDHYKYIVRLLIT